MAIHHKKHKPFLFAKLDIKDRFWRMAVGDKAAWNFCYVLPSITPTSSIDNICIMVPNSLQMGWCKSPPFFCLGTKTARDVIADLINSGTHEPPYHHFEEIMLKEFKAFGLSAPRNGNLHQADTDITALEVYVDNFCGMTNVLDESHL